MDLCIFLTYFSQNDRLSVGCRNTSLRSVETQAKSPCKPFIPISLYIPLSPHSSWGESAGAVSVGFHLIANNGNNEGLFRAAFMQSGSPTAHGDITNAQKYYDFMVSETNCTNAADTLECLRGVPFDAFKAAQDKSPGIFAYQVRVLSPTRLSWYSWL